MDWRRAMPCIGRDLIGTRRLSRRAVAVGSASLLGGSHDCPLCPALQYKFAPGHLSSLMQCVVASQLDVSLRQAAAIQFKNLCLRVWDPDTGDGQAPPQQQLRPEDKALVRANMLEAVVQAPARIQSQLVVALRVQLEADYPDAWPDLLPSVLAALQSPEVARVAGALAVLRVLCRKYEYKDVASRPQLHAICAATLPSLHGIATRLLASVSAAGGVARGCPEEVVGQVPTLLKLVLKSLWSCVYMDIPPSLQAGEVFHGWMGVLGSVISLSLPLEAQPGDVEERQQWPWWKAKKWALRICNRIFQRYSNPRGHSHPGHKAFAQHFKQHYAPSLVQAYIQQLAQLAVPGAFLSDRVINYALSLLQSAVPRKELYPLIAAAAPVLVYQVTFPLLCFNPADAEVWAEDPQEYIRKGYDILEDMYSPRTAAMSFITQLVRKRPEQLHPFLAFLVGVLHRCAPGTPPEGRPYEQLDGALFALGALSETLKRKAPYAEQLENMLVQHILPEFANPRGHLRAKACWVAGMYADIEFADSRHFTALMQCVIERLGDPELPVKVDGVVALRCFVEAAVDVAPLRAILHALLNALFALMAEVENEDLIFTVEAIVEKFGDEMAPFAVGLITNLVHQFWRALGQGAGADGDGDEDDDSGAGTLACLGCLRTIATVLDAVSGQAATLYPQLEPLLQPLCERMLTEEGLDVYEEVLEILAYLTYYTPTISDWAWRLFPRLVHNVTTFGSDYFGDTLTPLDNLISRDTERFLTGTDAQGVPHPQAVLGLCASVLGNEELEDDDCVCAPQLLVIVLQHCRGRVDGLVEHMLRMVAARLEGARPAVEPFFRDVLLLVWANALFYNPLLALQAAVRSGTLGPLLRAWHVALQRRGKDNNKRKHFKREQDKKLCVLGLTSLVSLPPGSAPPEVESSHGVLLSTALQLLSELKQQRDARIKADAEGGDDEEGDEDDSEDSDDAVDEEEDDTQLVAGGAGGGQHHRQLRGDDGDDDGDADSDWSDFTEEEDGAEGPLDEVDPWVLTADVLHHLAQAQPQRWAALQHGLTFPAQAMLRELPAVAMQRRNDMAAERAAKLGTAGAPAGA